MGCSRNSSLFISYNDDESVLISRCCLLQEKKTTKTDLFNKDFKDLALEAINYAPRNGHSNQCSFDCGFTSNIRDVCINSIAVCNLRCYHCCSGFDGCVENFYPHLFSKEELSNRKKFTFDILNYLKGKHLHAISLDGSGEIFVYYNDLIEYLKTLSPSDTETFYFLTNATLLNDKRIMELYNISKATGVDYSFNISIDGLSEETFNACRPNADFKKVLSNLNLIQKLFTYVDVTFTVKRPNIEDVPNVENFFKDMNVHLVWNSDYFDEKYCSQFVKPENRWA